MVGGYRVSGKLCGVLPALLTHVVSTGVISADKGFSWLLLNSTLNLLLADPALPLYLTPT